MYAWTQLTTGDSARPVQRSRSRWHNFCCKQLLCFCCPASAGFIGIRNDVDIRVLICRVITASPE